MKKYQNYTKEQLIQKIKQLESKKYGLVWDDEKEPENVVVECQNNIPILKKIDDKTIKKDIKKPTNILIEGDNYHALQVLNYTHKGQIDVIYIDPPYNTGNKDFKYNDDYVDKDNGYRHSKWLNFMSKRLKLAHNLLKDSGVIFISIDDNEVAQLKLLCDDIFYSENHISLLPTIMNLKGNNDQFGFSGTHEYTLVYAKNIKNAVINFFEIDENEKLKNWLEDDIGYYKKGRTLLASGDESFREDRAKSYFPVLVKNEEIYLISDDEYKNIYNQDFKEFNDNFVNELIEKYENLGYEIVLPIDSRTKKYLRWEWGFEGKFKKYAKEIIVYRTKKGDITLYKKQRPELGDLPTKKPKSIFYKPEYSSGNGTLQLKEIFNSKTFNNPKPIELIKDIIYLGSNKNSTILDFFAGSGTTGHAVLELNKEDGGNRQFILCTNNENNICEEVTYPRISKVINGYTTPKDVNIDGLAGNLDYYQTDLIPTDGISNITDTTREELTKKAGNMIAIKENTHFLVSHTEYYQIFQNESTKKQTAIYFTEDLSCFDELIEITKSYFTKLYIFSFGKIDKSSYKYLGKNYQIEDIPEPIIEIYKEMNKEGIL